MKPSLMVRTWGTTPDERELAFPCDEALPGCQENYFRGVTVFAGGPAVFRWLCQLRVAPYSYDWIDNLGRRSPRELTPDLDQLAVGQRFMRIFDLVSFERDRHVTLQLRSPGLFPPFVVSYVIVEEGPHRCRLLAKLALRLRPGLRDRVVAWLAPWLDWIMMRRQLLNLKDLAERTP